MNHSSHSVQRKEIREMQENKLQELLSYLKSNSPYYQKIFYTGTNRYSTDSKAGRP